MNLEQIEKRSKEIREAMLLEDADLDALQKEAEELIERKAELAIQAKQEVEERKQNIDAVIHDKGTVIEERKESKKMDLKEIRSSKEYKEAYGKYLASMAKGMPDATEARAMLTENATGGSIPVPAGVDALIQTAWETNSIIGKARKAYVKGNMKVAWEISSTGATVHEEGGDAVQPQQMNIGSRELISRSIKKVALVSDEALDQVEWLVDFVYDELSHYIAEGADEALIDDIAQCPASTNATMPGVPQIVAENGITANTISDAISALSARATDIYIIMNRQTQAEFERVASSLGYAYDVYAGLKDKIIFTNLLP